MAAVGRIFLTGFMGSGKSVVGTALAARLTKPFVDLDQLIVKRAGKEISEIFAEEGEAAFRRAEADELRRTLDLPEAVIAVGGGALATGSAMSFALENGVVIYLRASPDELVSRLMRGHTKRPMLLRGSDHALHRSELYERISTLLADREPIYDQSHITVETDGRSISEVVDEIHGRITSSLESE